MDRLKSPFPTYSSNLSFVYLQFCMCITGSGKGRQFVTTGWFLLYPKLFFPRTIIEILETINTILIIKGPPLTILMIKEMDWIIKI